LVRGAYIVEETKLAEEKGYENPVVDNFDQTTENYLGNLEKIMSNFSNGEVVVASHNQDTIDKAK